MPLKSVAGLNTSIFASAFFRDYRDSLIPDPENLPRYFITGNSAAIAAKHLSYFFDLKGLSIVVNTGCFIAYTALHLACQSLGTGDVRMFIIGCANVMLDPDAFVSILTCSSFRMESLLRLAAVQIGKGLAKALPPSP